MPGEKTDRVIGDIASPETGTVTQLLTALNTELLQKTEPADIQNVAVVSGGSDGIIRDGSGAGQADVIGTVPVGTEQGLVTRPIEPVFSTTLNITGTGNYDVDLTNQDIEELTLQFNTDFGVYVSLFVSNDGTNFVTPATVVDLISLATVTSPFYGVINQRVVIQVSHAKTFRVNCGIFSGATTLSIRGSRIPGFLYTNVTNTVTVSDGAGSLTVDGTVTANPATSFGKTITYVSVAQGAAGTTVLAAASVGNKHKLVGACLVGDVAGTVSLTDGTATLCGAMPIAANAGFVLPTSALPYTETAATNRPLNLVTATTKVSGMVAIFTEP